MRYNTEKTKDAVDNLQKSATSLPKQKLQGLKHRKKDSTMAQVKFLIVSC